MKAGFLFLLALSGCALLASPAAAQICDDHAPRILGITPLIGFPLEVDVDAAEGVPLEFEIGAADPDGEAITSLIASFINLPAGHDATFTPAPDHRTGVVRWTPQAGQAGDYLIGFLASNGRSGSGAVTAHVRSTGGDPFISAPAGFKWFRPLLIEFTAMAGDPDGDPIASLTADLSDFPAGNQPTFVESADHRSGVFSWTPAATSAGPYTLILSASSTTTATRSVSFFQLYDGLGPELNAPACALVEGGSTLTIEVQASSTTGSIVSLQADLSALPPGATATFVETPDHKSGIFAWTTLATDVQNTPYPVTFQATDNEPGLDASITTSIFVDNAAVNQIPIANAGPDQSTFVGGPLCLDGSASRDLDGAILSYLWDFGDGTTGVGVQPCHTWSAGGLYTLTLTVSDGIDTDSDNATVGVSTPAGVLFQTGTYKLLRLGSQKPIWCTHLEASNGQFSVSAVDLPSVRLQRPGLPTSIPAIVDKGIVLSDADRDGVPDLQLCFRKEDLRVLFADTQGKQSVQVSVVGALSPGGGNFNATSFIEVSSGGGGGALTAMVRPHPLNRSGAVAFTTSAPGRAALSVYDLNGRLLRTIRSAARLGPGSHTIPFDGRDRQGRQLASGVYLFRVEAGGEAQSGRFTILR